MTALQFSTDADEDHDIRQQTLRAARAIADSADPAATGIVGHLPIVVGQLLAMYEEIRHDCDRLLAALNEVHDEDDPPH